MLSAKPIAVGIIAGTIYDFPEVGDVLPMHDHIAGGAHISIIARGSFLIRGPGYEIEAKQGQLFDFEPDQAHEFVAREAASRVVNIVK